MDGYNKLYGPGSDFQKKYYPEGMLEDHWQANPNWLEDAVKDILHEGFYDWDKHGLMQIAIQRSNPHARLP